MRPGAPLVLLALLAWGCPLPQPTPASETVAGVYHTRVPTPDASARIVTLWLQPDGTALLERVDVGKEKLPTEGGTWVAAGDELTVQLAGEEAPLVFTIEPKRLVPKRWDQELYGPSGLLLTRRASYQSEGPNIFEVPQRPPPDARH